MDVDANIRVLEGKSQLSPDHQWFIVNADRVAKKRCR